MSLDTTAANVQIPAPNNEDALKLVEAAKKAAAIRAVDDYFTPDMRFVGIGSGTTIQYVVEEIKNRLNPQTPQPIMFVPTGFQSRQEIEKRDLIAFPFHSLPRGLMLDVAFDGADEVDEEFNCVKGGGACLFQEKLVAMRAKKFVCVADFRKDVPRLLTDWTYIPIEVVPIAEKVVIQSLKDLGSPNPSLRMSTLAKSGPLKTDQDNYIVMAPFPPLLMKSDINGEGGPVGAGETMGKTKEGLESRVWEVNKLATAIKGIVGVLDVGLFTGMNGPEATKLHAGRSAVDAATAHNHPEAAVAGHRESTGVMASQGGQKPVAVYFGMQDGSVKVRKAPGEE